jgi:hypothetical protein
MAKDFTLDDFRQQLDQVETMAMKDQLGRMPGMSALAAEAVDLDLAVRRIRQMIDAMTDEERRNPDLITSSCLSRIATSSGTQPKDVEDFLAQFYQVRPLMQQVAGWSLWQRIKMVYLALRPDGGIRVTLSKIAALVVAIGWVIAAFWEKSWILALPVAVGMLLPLALIWFSEWGTRIECPPRVLAALGWLVLLGLPVLMIWARTINP